MGIPTMSADEWWFVTAYIASVMMGIMAIWDGKFLVGWILLGTSFLVAVVIMLHQL
jgi:hypothetical protein